MVGWQRRKVTRTLILAAAASLVSAACAGSPGGSVAPSAPGTAGEGGSVSIRGCAPQNPLIPGNTTEVCGGIIVDATTAMLVRYDTETGAAELDIAESIETSDHRVYTIRIKPGYLFQDGSEVTASSFVDAWNYTAYGLNAQINASFFEPVEGFEQVNPPQGGTPIARDMRGLRVVDDHAFTVTLSRPIANLVARLGYRAFAPLPEVFFADPEAFARAPIAAGPYEVTEIARDLVTLTRFDGYAGAHPGHVDTVAVRLYPNVDAAYQDVQSGLLDVLGDLPVDVASSGRFRTEFPSRFLTRPVGTDSSLNFAAPQADPDVQHPRLRQALSMAIDREAIADDLFGEARIPADGWVSPVVSGYRPGGCGPFCTYDPETAKRLLAEAGGYSGQLTLWYNADSDHGPWTTAACRSIRITLGVNCISTPVLDLATLRDRVENRTITGMYRSAWVMNYPSIDNYLMPLFFTGGIANDAGYSNPVFDAKLAEAAAAPAASERARLYQDAERMLQLDMPTIPMFHHRAIAVWSPRVTDVWLTPTGAVDLTRLRVVG